MRNSSMYAFCNIIKDVLKANCLVYACLVLNFINEYITGRCNIVDMNSLSKKMKADIQRDGIYKYIHPWLPVKDDVMITKLQAKLASAADSGTQAEVQTSNAKKNKYENKEVKSIKQKTDAVNQE